MPLHRAQVGKAIVHFGAADAKSSVNEYDLVFDESMQVEFVMETTLAGESHARHSELVAITETERKSALIRCGLRLLAAASGWAGLTGR